MKALIYRYGSICEPDVISGFETLGFEVSQLTNEVDNKNLTYADGVTLISQYLLDHPQDFVFSINFFPYVSEVCNIFKIRYISWIVDAPVMELFTKSISNPYNRVFIFDREQYKDIHPFNPENIFHYPLAVNTTDKQNVIRKATLDQQQRFHSDISFVGSLYTEKCPYDKLTNPPRHLAGYLDGIMQAQLHVYGYYFIEELLTDDIIFEFKKHFPTFYSQGNNSYLTDKITLSQLYIGNKITALERLKTMDQLSKHFSVDLYTGSDTSTLPAIHNKGFAKTLTEMPIIFHESKINLNTTSKIIRSGIPLRVFDIMGCEGFMLSNYQPELFDYFEPQIDFDYYTSMEELIDKADYYLHHEKERKEIAHNGFEKVSKEFNYPIRLARLMEIAYGISN